jgi:site-specific DNA-methyltransferase (adenine-specific)
VAKSAREERRSLAALPDVPVDALPARPVTANSVANTAKRQRLRTRLQQQAAGAHTTDAGLIIGDFREAGAAMLDASVDLVLTDPPYLVECVPLYGDLAQFAARVLRPGGLCLAYAGTFPLNQAMALRGEHSQYFWTFATVHGGGSVMRMYNLRNMWKPVLAFVKPPVEAWWEITPACVRGGREKSDHEWQQALAEAAHFVNHFCPAGGLVLDPFAGSGTSLVAAAKHGRRYVGFEIDPETAARARARIAEELRSAASEKEPA